MSTLPPPTLRRTGPSDRAGRNPAARQRTRRPQTVWPAWFAGGSLLVAVAASAGLDGVTLALLVIIVGVASARDLWQVGLLLLLSALVIAAGSSTLRSGLPLPFLLRFVLASGLVVLTVVLHRGRGLPSGVRRHSRVLGVFFVAAGIGVLLSDFPVPAAEAVAGSAVMLGIPVVAARGRWKDPARVVADLAALHRYLFLLTLVGLAMAANAGFAGRAAGLHFNPNTFAYIALLGFGLDLGLRKQLPWWAMPVTAPVFAVGVLATGSRGALLGILLAPSYLLLRRRGRQRSARIAAGMMLGVAFLLIAPLPAVFDLGSAIERTFGEEEFDLSGRQVAWDNMLVLFRDRPAFGQGLRTTIDALSAAQEVGAVDGSAGGHSSYVQMLAETGVLGTVPLFGSVLLALLRKAPRTTEALSAWVAASGVVIGGLGHMIGESFVLGVGSPFPLVFWIGVTVLALVGTDARGSRRAAG